MRTIALVLLAAAPAWAAPGGTGSQGLLSVLELRNKLQGADKASVDAGYLTDRIRSEIFDSPLDVKVMTRENMLVLLEAQGKSLEQCEGTCAADTGRKLGADYVISGDVLRSGAELKLSLNLYETQGGTLVGTVTESGHDVDALDGQIKTSVAKLIAPLVSASPAPGPVAQAPVQRIDPSMGAVRMSIMAPPEGRWFLHDESGAQLCKLPCTKMVPRGNRDYIELDADRANERRRLEVPPALEFSSGRSVEARYEPRRGSRVWPVLTGLSSIALFGLAGAAFSSHCPEGDTCSSGSGPLIGTISIVAGIGVVAASIYWFVWAGQEHLEARLAR